MKIHGLKRLSVGIEVLHYVMLSVFYFNNTISYEVQIVHHFIYIQKYH